MHVGPEKDPLEQVSSFRYRQARYCGAWACVSAPVLWVAIQALRSGLGDGGLWVSMVFIAFLAGSVLGMALVGGAGLLLGAFWAGCCERSDTFAQGWQRARFILASLIVVPLWFWICYEIWGAITLQQILSGRPARLVTLADEPAAFLMSLILHAALLVMLPTYWVVEARERLRRKTREAAQRDTAPNLPAGIRPMPSRLPTPTRQLRPPETRD